MEDLINRNAHLVKRIRKYESEDRFAHTLRMTELAIYTPNAMVSTGI